MALSEGGIIKVCIFRNASKINAFYIVSISMTYRRINPKCWSVPLEFISGKRIFIKVKCPKLDSSQIFQFKIGENLSTLLRGDTQRLSFVVIRVKQVAL